MTSVMTREMGRYEKVMLNPTARLNGALDDAINNVPITGGYFIES